MSDFTVNGNAAGDSSHMAVVLKGLHNATTQSCHASFCYSHTLSLDEALTWVCYRSLRVNPEKKKG